MHRFVVLDFLQIIWVSWLRWNDRIPIICCCSHEIVNSDSMTNMKWTKIFALTSTACLWKEGKERKKSKCNLLLEIRLRSKKLT